MKLQINYSIDKNNFGIIFIPTVLFYKYKNKKLLSFAWLCFEIEINF